MDRNEATRQRALSGERQENRGRDFSKFNPIYEARVMGYAVDVAGNIESLKRACVEGKNGQAHPVEVWEINTNTGTRRQIAQWNFMRAA